MVQPTDGAVSHVVELAGDVGNVARLPNFQLGVILSLANKIFPLALRSV